MSITIRDSDTPEAPIPLLRAAVSVAVIIAGLLAAYLSVRLIFTMDSFPAGSIRDLIILNATLWAATTLLIIVPLIGIRPPPGPEPPIPEEEDQKSAED